MIIVGKTDENMKTLLVFFLLLFSATGNSQEPLAAQPFQYGVHLFQTNRFENAEGVFKKIYDKLKAKGEQASPMYYQTLYFLAMSRSEQGKIVGVSSLIEEMLSISISRFGENSFETAKVMLNYGETRYREGNTKAALEIVDGVEKIYKTLDPKPDQFQEYINANRIEYRSGDFDKSKLPPDLSHFYTACDSLVVGKAFAKEKLKMAEFIQVGVDFTPTGVWADIFANAQLQEVKGPTAYSERVIIIPANDQRMYDEWCVVFIDNGIVIKTAVHEG